MKKIILLAILSCGFISNAFAAGDATAGKAKAAACASCHGANGIGIADNYPNLAGQHADYIAKQLKAFKEGSRVDPLMAPMVAALSDQDMADIAAYFASFSLSGEAPAGSATSASAPSAAPVAAAPSVVANAAAGKDLYNNGDVARGITACVACHGDKGDSEVLINPNLSKQHPEYIEKQLHAFIDGSRIDPSMNTIAKHLSEQDVLDLGAYFKDPAAVASTPAPKKSAAKLTFVGDVEAGKAKAMVCASCHGADGNSLIAVYPKLAGQHEQYLAKQIADFKAATVNADEGRNDPVMGGMVATLSTEDIQDLAAFFASQKTTPTNVATNATGEKLYNGGDANRGITACIACHGVDGKGAALAGFPTVSSQNLDYLKTQLNKFRDGSRHNDMNSMMTTIASKLTDDDIAAVAEYMSSLK
ncbi:cytochrome c [Thalassomonas sp. M1454]|uniref:c-type cytochrome n=1 Tax=Thalassomonas sp. M1454 TaxID=2594477 RepID=UPI0021B11D98|nr:cytochrome c4 [Thalassomonas sp. M1454]